MVETAPAPHAGAHPQTPQRTSEGRNLAGDILAIIGSILLLIIVIWGLVHMANLSGGWFSSLFPNKGGKITVTAPAEVTSGTKFVISWSYMTSTKGSYALLYQCSSAVKLEKQSAVNTTLSIPCGAAFTLGTSDNKATLLPLLAGTTTKVPLTIIFMPFGTSTEAFSAQAQGSVTVTVKPGTAGATSIPQPEMTTAKKSAAPPSSTRPSTPADLAVRIVGIGVIDPSNGMFVNRLPTSPNDLSAVQFDISNDGGSSTGPWYFIAQLPTMENYTYTSPPQAPLGPGDHIVNTLRFTQVAPGGGIFEVIVDPVGQVTESNKSNNIASQTISPPMYYNNQYQYQQPYQQPYYPQYPNPTYYQQYQP